MSHPDDETLVDLALGDPQSPELSVAKEHVSGCDDCEHDVARFRRAYGLVSTVEPSAGGATGVTYAGWSAPPPQVWSRISEAIADESAGDHSDPRAPDPLRAPLRAVDPAAPATGEAVSRPDDAPDRESDRESDGETGWAVRREGGRRDGRRGGRRGRYRVLPWAAGTAAAGLAIGLLTGRVLWSEPMPTPVAQVALDTLDTKQHEGAASLVNTGGGMELRVSTSTPLAAGNGYLEVWLINSDGKRMVSVGVLRGEGPETFPISRVLIEQGYVVVDISQEQFDDKPQHSGDSLLRGTLPA